MSLENINKCKFGKYRNEKMKTHTLVVLNIALFITLLLVLSWNFYLCYGVSKLNLVKMQTDQTSVQNKAKILKSNQSFINKNIKNSERHETLCNLMNRLHRLSKRSDDQFYGGNKAIGIHLQARNQYKLMTFNSYMGNTIYGQTLKGDLWKIADKRQTLFGTSMFSKYGYVAVPADGYYFLYMQMTFSGAPSINMIANLKVGIMGGNNFVRCLVTQTKFNANKYTPCHASGVKYLRKGEGFSLSVNPRGVQIVMNPSYTYFGAFMIGV